MGSDARSEGDSSHPDLTLVILGLAVLSPEVPPHEALRHQHAADRRDESRVLHDAQIQERLLLGLIFDEIFIQDMVLDQFQNLLVV